MKLLLLEEKANASFRQVVSYSIILSLSDLFVQSIRYVFHELSSPLNSMSIGLATMEDDNLSVEGKEALLVTKSSCNAIIKNLHDIRDFQVTFL